jgi:peptidyl-tRNA hydrolase
MRIKILVRRNLRMTPNKTAAQCVHAALGLYRQNPLECRACVVLDASDKQFRDAEAQYPNCYVVVDAGWTEVNPGTKTCLAFYEFTE